MRLFKSAIISLSVLLSTSAFAAVDFGGHDGGGANLWVSSPEQVKDAINWAIGDLRKTSENPGYANWLFFAMPYGPKVPVEGAVQSASLIQCMENPVVCMKPGQLLQDIGDNKTIYDSAWSFLRLSPLELKEDGPCPASDKDHAAGSVSEFKFGANLCLSVSELSRTVPSGLRAQVASVLAHEMAHLMGYGEEIATQVQKGVVENFPRIAREDGASSMDKVIGSMMKVDSALFNAMSLSSEANMAPGLYLMGYVYGELDATFTMLPDGINDRSMPVAKPELYAKLKAAFTEQQNQVNDLASATLKLSKAEFDGRVQELQKKELALSLLLEDFLGKHVIRN